jgi:hypothetical protein
MKKVLLAFAIFSSISTLQETIGTQAVAPTAAPIVAQTPDGTVLWNGATFRRDGSGFWIQGNDRGDPQSKKPESLPFTVKLVPLTPEHLDELANNLKKRRGFRNFMSQRYTRYLWQQLGQDFSKVKENLRTKRTFAGYAIYAADEQEHPYNTLVGFIYNEGTETSNGKAYIDSDYSQKGYASQAYITLVKSKDTNRTCGGSISIGNTASLNALAAAINRGGLTCKLAGLYAKKAGVEGTPLTAEQVRVVANLGGDTIKIKNSCQNLSAIIQKQLDECSELWSSQGQQVEGFNNFQDYKSTMIQIAFSLED